MLFLKTICEGFVSRSNVALYNNYFLFLINIHVLDYQEPKLSGLFRPVSTSPDNRGSTVYPTLCERSSVFTISKGQDITFP